MRSTPPDAAHIAWHRRLSGAWRWDTWRSSPARVQAVVFLWLMDGARNELS